MTDKQRTKLELLGVDIEEVLERFVGSEDFYFRCLNKFANESYFNDMETALCKGDAGRAFDAAHAMKGVTGNLGFKFLFEEVRDVTEIFRKGETYVPPEKMDSLTKAYHDAINVINSL